MKKMVTFDGHLIALDEVSCVTPYRPITPGERRFVVLLQGGHYVALTGDRDEFARLVEDANQGG